MLCHRHRRLDALTVAGSLHPHDASEHPPAKAIQGISSLSKPRHLSIYRNVCCQTALALEAFFDPLAFQQSGQLLTLGYREMSPCTLREVASVSTLHDARTGVVDSVAKAGAFSDA
jgi:hypothetical protein